MKLGIFLGIGGHTDFCNHVEDIGEDIAIAGHVINYSGARSGLAGALATGALKAGGRVNGFMSKSLYESKEYKPGIDITVTDGLESQHQIIRDSSDALIVMPGGSGTLTALFTSLWQLQYKINSKPLAIYSIGESMSHLRLQLMLFERLGLCKIPYLYSRSFDEILKHMEHVIGQDVIELEEEDIELCLEEEFVEAEIARKIRDHQRQNQ